MSQYKKRLLFNGDEHVVLLSYFGMPTLGVNFLLTIIEYTIYSIMHSAYIVIRK